MARKAVTFEQLEALLDRRSYEWLGVEDGELLEIIEGLVKDGAEPRDIRFLTHRATGRDALSDRCFQAARHVARMQA